MKKPQFSKIPITSGVYLFKRNRRILYIGKAKNLRDRLRNYFTANTPAKIQQLTQEATGIKIIKTGTEPDSLILESQLIKKYQPQYNVVFRDDKSYFYVVFTRDTLPKVVITHKTQIQNTKYKIQDTVGPFTDGTSLKKLLKQLRRLLHFCTCQGWHERPCIPASLGLCAGACCLKPKILTTKYPYLATTKLKIQYQQNIKLLQTILSGKHKAIVKQLEAQMRSTAAKQNFETAGELRDFIRRLELVWQHSLISGSDDQLNQLTVLEEMKKTLRLPTIPHRIEGYDISNIFGTEAVGSMVVFTNGAPNKDHYRKFKIKTVQDISDVAMLQEVLRRRLKHREWPLPDLFFIDGGQAQLNVAIKIARSDPLSHKATEGLRKIPIIAFAKGKQEVWNTTLAKPVPLQQLPEKVGQLIVQIKDEAHRFAIGYHRKLRSSKLTRQQPIK